MAPVIAFLYFLVYILAFFVAEVVRFRYWIFQGDHAPGMLFVFLVLAMISGYCVLAAFKKLELLKLTTDKQVFYGTIFGVASFLVFFIFEDVISENRLMQSSDPKVFSEIRGHCGAYAGRAILKYYYVDVDPTPAHLILDYEMSDHCRLAHFADLKKNNVVLCDKKEDEVQCQVRWMDIFAEKGFWNAADRKVFLDEVLSIKSRVRSDQLRIQEDSWYNYALKDHDLVGAHSGTLKQAGIDEQFSDEYNFYKYKDELDDLKMTEEIFTAIRGMKTEDTPLSPGLVKFQDLDQEVRFDIEKIPELEKQIGDIKKRLNYNPSL